VQHQFDFVSGQRRYGHAVDLFGSVSDGAQHLLGALHHILGELCRRRLRWLVELNKIHR
jgi:hypothetical protein